MKQLITRFWNDDQGAIISIEYLFFATIVLIGLVIGFAALRDAVVVELTELGNAILALSQGFTVSGLSNGDGSVDGSATMDTPGLLTNPTAVAPSLPSNIDVPVP